MSVTDRSHADAGRAGSQVTAGRAGNQVTVHEAWLARTIRCTARVMAGVN